MTPLPVLVETFARQQVRSNVPVHCVVLSLPSELIIEHGLHDVFEETDLTQLFVGEVELGDTDHESRAGNRDRESYQVHTDQ